MINYKVNVDTAVAILKGDILSLITDIFAGYFYFIGKFYDIFTFVEKYQNIHYCCVEPIQQMTNFQLKFSCFITKKLKLLKL